VRLPLPQLLHSCRAEVWSAIDNGLQRRDEALPFPRDGRPVCLARRSSILPRPPRIGDLLTVRLSLQVFDVVSTLC